MVEAVAIEGPLDPDRLEWVAELYGAVDPKYLDRGVPPPPLRAGPGRASAPRVRARRRRARRPCRRRPDAARRGTRRFAPGSWRRWSSPSRTAAAAAAACPWSAWCSTPSTRSPTRAGSSCSTHSSCHASAGPSDSSASTTSAPPSLVALLKTVAVRSGCRSGACSRRRAARRCERSRARALRARSRSDLARRHLGRRRHCSRRLRFPTDSWAVVAEGAWDWYTSSPYVRILEPGDGSRALVQLPGWPREPLRVAAWDSPSPGFRSAVRAPRRSRATGARDGAATLRLQIARPDPSLRRAARALGFVERSDLTTLWVRSADPALARTGAVVADGVALPRVLGEFL